MATITVTRVSQLVLPAGSGPALLANLDAATTIYLDSTRGVSTASNQLPPLGTMAVDGAQPWFAITSGADADMQVIPGGSSFSPGSLTINGPVTAEITGPVEVDGSVSISGTPTVDLAAGATVDIGGTTDVSVQNATIDVIGSGGFVLPGELSLLAKNNSAFTATAGNSSLLGNGSVDNFSSILFTASSPSNSSTATGAAVCAMWVFEWTDASGNVITTDTVSCLMKCEFSVQVPIKGSALNVYLYNNGSVGTITYAANSILMWGDYRTVPDITVMSYGISSLPTITGWTLIQPADPVLQVAQWIASLNQGSEVASTQYLLPLPLWRGQVSGWYSQVTEPLAFAATLVDLTYAVQGSIPAGTSYGNGIITIMAAAAGSNATPNYFSPPTQLAFLFKTGSTANGQTELYLTGST